MIVLLTLTGTKFGEKHAPKRALKTKTVYVHVIENMKQLKLLISYEWYIFIDNTFFSFHSSRKDLGDQEKIMKQIIIDKLLLI